MDHCHVSFWDMMWAYYFVAPNAASLWIGGILKLFWRRFWHKYGCVRPKPVDHNLLAANLLLESMQVVRFAHMEAKGGGVRHAVFRIERLPYVTRANELKVAELVVEIALPAKSMTAASLDGKPITASQAVTLLWFDTIFAFHGKLHAYANWSVNVLNQQSRYVRRTSTITVMYNYFGHTFFPQLSRYISWLGILRHDWRDGPAGSHVSKVLESGIHSGLFERAGDFAEILPHSRLGRFVFTLRTHFHEAFNEHRATFPNAEVDALYMGSVIHSLDHYCMSLNVLDFLWLDVSDDDFGHLAEMGRFVRAGFVEDIPCVCWPRKFRRAPHPFYRAVHAKAHQIDQELADAMDTAIIK